jgi:hypothetical protein
MPRVRSQQHHHQLKKKLHLASLSDVENNITPVNVGLDHEI